jgi:hypothetical protein
VEEEEERERAAGAVRVLNQRHLRLRGDSPRCVCEWPEQFYCKISGTATRADRGATRLAWAGGAGLPDSAVLGCASPGSSTTPRTVRCAVWMCKYKRVCWRVRAGPVQYRCLHPASYAAQGRYRQCTAGLPVLSGPSGLCQAPLLTGYCSTAIYNCTTHCGPSCRRDRCGRQRQAGSRQRHVEPRRSTAARAGPLRAVI